MNTKREWYYINPPRSFEISACECGNCNTAWSEYEGYIWCPECSKDFIPRSYGVLDGNVPVMLCHLVGINFDRYNITSGVKEVFDVKFCKYN